MGLIQRLIGVSEVTQGVGRAVENIAEVYTVNRTKAELARLSQSQSVLSQYSSEFTTERRYWFDSLIDGLNRLPRPTMALGTVGLFVFAMADPVGFTGRMQGLSHVPDPLWWLLGAIVSFYFGARELHYARKPAIGISNGPVENHMANRQKYPDNAALEEWAVKNE